MNNGDLLDLRGRKALVTGAGRGVGRTIALQLAAHGAGAVVVNDFEADRAEAVAAEVEALGVPALAVRADVSDFADVEAMFKKAADRFGGIDILVNNAGNSGARGVSDFDPPFWTQSPDMWPKWIGVNLYGVMNCCRVALPHMVASKHGRIVTVISDAARVGEAGLEVYSAAKAGAAALMRSLARSVGRFDVTANAVAIAATRTPFVAAALESEAAAAQLKRYAIRRFGEPEDAANMVLFLASDAASWITGQTYPVNGGYSMNQ